MNIIQSRLADCVIIEPKVFGDERGYFVETFRQDKFEAAVGHKVDFIQDNESKSTKGVLRGLHFQLPPYAQSRQLVLLLGAARNL